MPKKTDKKLKANDRRLGTKPSVRLSKKVKTLFTEHLVYDLATKLEVDYKTLKKIENREPVKQYVIDSLESKLETAFTA